MSVSVGENLLWLNMLQMLSLPNKSTKKFVHTTPKNSVNLKTNVSNVFHSTTENCESVAIADDLEFVFVANSGRD